MQNENFAITYYHNEISIRQNPNGFCLFFVHGREADSMGKLLLTLISCAVVIIKEITKDEDD